MQYTKETSLRIQAEKLTQKAIDAIDAIGTAIVSRRIPFPADWATTICSALRQAVDRLETKLVEGSENCKPFSLSRTQEAGEGDV